jgi:hypothetical protein
VKHPRILQLGMLFLVLANTSNWYFRHHPALGENRIDAINGFLMGVAIATMLLGIVAMRRGGSRCRRAT